MIRVYSDDSVSFGSKRIIILYLKFKARVHCFSMQVVVNKSFLLNPEKKFGAEPSCRF